MTKGNECDELAATLAPAHKPSMSPDVTLTVPGSSPPSAPSTRAQALDHTVPATAHNSVEPAELPTRLPSRYRRGAQIAQGGMGRIVEVFDCELGRTVAIKETLSSSTVLKQRFEREVRITARLQHPSIISVLEAGQWPSGEPFFVMKKIEGRAFDKVIAERDTLAKRLVLLPTVVAVADALAYAHSQKIIHRDLKPANILVGDFGETVVIDWGLAKDLTAPVSDDDQTPVQHRTPDSVQDSLTVVGKAMGTPAYMPPEQARGLPVDERADVYALGAMLYHLLGGKMPFQDTAATSVEELLIAVRTQSPTPLSELEASCPVDLRALVEKAMARDPKDRYVNAGEFAQDLKRFEAGLRVTAHTYSAAALVGRWVRRHRAPVIVAVAMVALLAAGGIASFVRISREHDRATEQKQVAQANRLEVEELLDFMLTNLREKLEPMGKLDVLGMVATKAAAYYAKRPVDWSHTSEVWARSLAHKNLCKVLGKQDNYAGAIDQCHLSLALVQRLLKGNTKNVDWQLGLIVGHETAGEIHRQEGKLDLAMEQHELAMTIRKRLLGQNPNASNRRSVAIGHGMIGVVAYEQLQLELALEQHQLSLEIRMELANANPSNDQT